MFEIIGGFVRIALFFCLSVGFGKLYERAAGLVVRSEHYQRLRKVGGLLPPLSAAYMLACAVVFSICIPGEVDRIFFDDIFERLPNGYTLKAMAKMPSYGLIEFTSATPRNTVTGWVGSLEVDGPFVFGAYSGENDSTPQGYFAFDTRSGRNLDFTTIQDLNRYAGHAVHLMETVSFTSSEPARMHLLKVERAIWMAPPVMCTSLYFLVLLILRRREAHNAPGR